MNRFLLWVAQGFGIGRIPAAPGTWGSVVGLIWFAVLLSTGRLWMFVAGGVLGLVFSVWICTVGERLLRKKDPGSVVFDEIAAMPLCFFSSLLLALRETGSWPGPAYFFSSEHWLLVAGTFAAFRLFDVAKPWPIRQSQALTGGLGITVDDALAAIYVNMLAALLHAARML